VGQAMPEPEMNPVHQTLFPTKDSLMEAMESIHAQLPITTSNELHAALMMYQNTLLHELTKANKEADDEST